VNVDAKLERGTCEFAVRSMRLSDVDCVFVRDVKRPGSVTSGLTELDALGAFRHSLAFLNDLDPKDIHLRILQ
jgi:hypothetical protein